MSMNKRTQTLWKQYKEHIKSQNNDIWNHNQRIWARFLEATKPVPFLWFSLPCDHRIVRMEATLHRLLIKEYTKPSMEGFLDWCESNKFSL